MRRPKSPVSMTGSAALVYLSDALWLSRHTFRKSQTYEKNPLLRPNKRPQSPSLTRRGSR